MDDPYTMPAALVTGANNRTRCFMAVETRVGSLPWQKLFLSGEWKNCGKNSSNSDVRILFRQ